MTTPGSGSPEAAWLAAAAAALPQQFAALAPAFEKALADVQQTFGTARSTATDAGESLGTSGSAATEGLSRAGNALLEATRANTNAVFDLTTKLLETRTVAEATEVWTAHAARQFEAFQGLTRELSQMARETVEETTAPLTRAAGAAGAAYTAAEETLDDAIRSVDAARKT